MEKVYKAMKSVGAFNVVFGTVVITKGAKLLKHKSDLMF